MSRQRTILSDLKNFIQCGVSSLVLSFLLPHTAQAASCIDPIEMRRLSQVFSEDASPETEYETLILWDRFSREFENGLRCVQGSASPNISRMAEQDIESLRAIQRFSEMLFEHDQNLSVGMLNSISGSDYTILDISRSAILALGGLQRRDAISTALWSSISQFTVSNRIGQYLGHWEQKSGCTNQDIQDYVEHSEHFVEGVSVGLDVASTFRFLFHTQYENHVDSYLCFVESALELDHPILLQTPFSQGISVQTRNFRDAIEELNNIRVLFRPFPDEQVMSGTIRQEGRYQTAISDTPLALDYFPSLSGRDVAEQAIVFGAVICDAAQASDVNLTVAENWLRYCTR